jgi:type VI secretion system secreted protein Hcp
MTHDGASRREVLRGGGALGMGALVATMSSGVADADAPGVTMAAVASGAQQFFLALDGIDGPSTANGFKKQIPVLSYSWGVSNTFTVGGGSGGGTGKAVEAPFAFTMSTNIASPALASACFTGKRLRSAVLHGVRTSGKSRVEYLTITLTEVLVSSLHQSEGNGHQPVDTVHLLYNSIKYVEELHQMTFTP